MPKPLELLSESEAKRKRSVGKVMTCALRYLTHKFVEEGFEWLLPVTFSKSTDPLLPDPSASVEKMIEVEVYGKVVKATLSMIVHKMVACSLIYPKLFVLSPNLRIESWEKARSGLHLYEFTQLDFEIRYASSEEVRRFVEDVICGLIGYLREQVKDELLGLNRYASLSVPRRPFKVYDREGLEERYGKLWETGLVFEIEDPVWVTNIPRQFYDFEDLESGKWDNYDLLLPKYGEVLSGSRREWEYGKMVWKIKRDNVREEDYGLLLKLAKEGKLKPSAGAGIGVERLIGWIVGAKHVGEVQLFPKVPGVVYDL